MDRLKILRKERRKTQQQMAGFLGISQQAYATYEIETRIPPIDILEKLADYFGVSVDYLLGRTDNPNNESNINVFSYGNIRPVGKQRLPVLGKIACGIPKYADNDIEFYIENEKGIKADFILIADGDSMIGARIHSGDVVFCREQSMVDNGDIAAVIIDDEATLKRVYYYPEKNKLVLQAENPKYEPLVYLNDELDQINIIGKAIAFQSNIK